MSAKRALADTSVFVGVENGRLENAALDDYELAVSVVTLGELELGVIRGRDPDATARRLGTLRLAQQFDPMPVDEQVAAAWALLVAKLRGAGRKAPINDTWIAATAIRHGVPLVTQDADHQHMPDLTVVPV
ncbi:MAG: type II toxin-antitoxin system VapC family toxin [Micromonosporaceae bacterium]